MRQGLLMLVIGVALVTTPEQPAPGRREAKSVVLKGHEGQVVGVAFSPDGKTLASCGLNGLGRGVILWEVASGKVRARLSPPRANASIAPAFSPDGKMLAWGDRDLGPTEHGHSVVKSWNLATNQIRSGCRGHYVNITSVALSPDGKYLATAAQNDVVKLWDVATGKERTTLRWHSDSACIWCVRFSPDGKTLASARTTGTTIRLWEVASGGFRASLRGHEKGIESLAFHPGGRLLASGGSDKTVRLWDVGTGRALGILKGVDRSICALAFDPNGQVLASGGGGEITLWSVDGWNKLGLLKGHTQEIFSVAFSPNGRILASGSSDGTVRLWDVSALTKPARARPAAPRAAGTR
jgi:WD40 repeat protein